SVPGPTKRLIRLRDPIRLPAKVPSKPEVVYVSLESKQGV
ncbi:50S ribosomal protein L3, partial [Methanosarcinales archaeon]